jgi:signal transduction histidine kinase
MGISLPLYGRISLLITGIAVISVLGFSALALWSSDRYHQEVTQKLHQGLAQYVLDHQPEPLLSDTGQVNQEGLRAIAKNTMMINPAVEVYLLDTEGNILGHALPEASVSPRKINLIPVHIFIEKQGKGPVLGENPRNPNVPGIFSAAALKRGGKTIGYLYIILASHEARSLAEQLADSHIIRLTIGALLAVALFFGLSTFFSFQVITRPLYRLTRNVRAYRKTRFSDDAGDEQLFRDEVVELEHSFKLMQERIQQQFDQLSETDRLRRELISNVSHDLRTPLASIQGYLETLLLKFETLDSQKQKHYLEIAHRHSKHMAVLVGQLFELSKLDAGRIEPQPEVFSLTELLFDIKQDYQLSADKKGVRLEIISAKTNALVMADIGLIQRVFQNLMDNALRYTPKGGSITISLNTEGHQVRVRFQDSGRGIADEDMPFVFERFYQAQSGQAKSNPIGAGLGLSIVKRILDLHGSAIEVVSTPRPGASFSFLLSGPAQPSIH